MTEQQRDEDFERVKAAVASLGEHFENVQIFATRFDPQEGTTNIHFGAGDFFARYGFVKTWCLKEERRSTLEVKPENDL